ncbi:MAG: hypothetical protein IKC52_01415 [Clostridia bacterium]|nr:hypothetical protein [Clostridia bacterium]
MSKKPLEKCKKLESAKKKLQYIIAKEQKTHIFQQREKTGAKACWLKTQSLQQIG